ncbi:LysR family transcriptional regulator [Nitratireductor kimnyeongensis]|uniref:LysR family transcriptional regulator n=1 Tax=Nitratireductor kimnyeongensis TaxID=430679 RepID=A0ABW0T9W8_9HYPH|nr:LysR family transcriptional regulator [Nitratireductor kimnyeongensis]QZZ35487.1 LysR family transcriptional regulator [Nitratireductor kimnyeongensis]
MIDDYRNLALFVAIADTGSLSAAGRRLKLSTSVVSHHLSRLEARLGVALFFRSTRSMSLTPEGRMALDAARRMVAAGEEALDALSATSGEPVGSLRIALPAFGERTRLRQALWSFVKQHPMVAITLHSSDAPADLIGDGFDLAIRLGTLADSSLKSRRIGDFGRVLVASRDYMAGRQWPGAVAELAALDFIGVTTIGDRITLIGKDESVTFEPEKVRLEVDTIASAKSAVVAGLGLRALPLSEVADEIASGELVRVLPDWSLPVLGIHAVWPDSGPQKALTRRLIDHFLADRSALMA